MTLPGDSFNGLLATSEVWLASFVGSICEFRPKLQLFVNVLEILKKNRSLGTVSA